MTDDRHSKAAPKRLGRGLAALIGEAGEGSAPRAADRSVPIRLVRRNPANPRRYFDPGDLDELAQSLAAHGFLSPIVVRPVRDGAGGEAYEIVAGERRWRAAQRAELHEVPIVVREVDDRLALELAIVENVQRADLNPIEEARGYEQLMERGYAQSDLAGIIGKSRSHLANTLRLMSLPEPVRRMVADGTLTAGHARALITAADPHALARRVAEEGLSVRETERLAKRAAQEGEATRPPRDPDPDTAALERRLTSRLGAAVRVNEGKRGGRLVIRYGSKEELRALVRRLETAEPDFD